MRIFDFEIKICNSTTNDEFNQLKKLIKEFAISIFARQNFDLKEKDELKKIYKKYINNLKEV